ncbi:MAG: oligopeptide/dipeptide ABC transporter ATP-binding protein [Bacilli bacterium]
MGWRVSGWRESGRGVNLQRGDRFRQGGACTCSLSLKMCGRHAHPFFEYAIEVGLIAVPQVLSDLSDRHLRSGRIVEMGKTDELLNHPLHPYTRRLIEAATFDVETGTPAVGGDSGQTAAELLESYIGCPFRRQCPIAEEVCNWVDPQLVQESGTHAVACHAMDD